MSKMTDIEDFHKKFNLGYGGPPRALPEDVALFRRKFMQEELDEYNEGLMRGNLVQQFDALIDLVYVALGTAYLQGLPFDRGWDAVQACNMAKVKAGPNGEGSKRGSPHDVIKPEGWQGPEARLQELLWQRLETVENDTYQTRMAIARVFSEDGQ